MSKNSSTHRRSKSSYAPKKSRYNSRKGRGNRSNYKPKVLRVDSNRFIKAAKPIEKTQYTPTNAFSDFKVDEIIQRNLVHNNITKPTLIQDKAIPVGLEGRDVIGIANTGTGKTVAFLLPVLHKLMANRGQKVLIVAPTRELAIQIQQESRMIARGGGIYDALLIGGTSFSRQLRDLNRNPQILIGTPGRIKDHIERKTLNLSSVSMIVLDEVDRMLDMGFINDIRNILNNVRGDRQSYFFSATLSRTIEELIKTFTNDPQTIMAKTAETSDNVDQSIIKYSHKNEKIDKLHDLLIVEDVEKTLIFCETKRFVESLSKDLAERGFKSDSIHGNKNQNQRERALRKFKNSEIEVLVATDVAARGLDVNGITHVVNYDLPQTYDDYTHRIGRTGRGSNIGYAVTFVTH